MDHLIPNMFVPKIKRAVTVVIQADRQAVDHESLRRIDEHNATCSACIELGNFAKCVSCPTELARNDVLVRNAKHAHAERTQERTQERVHKSVLSGGSSGVLS